MTTAGPSKPQTSAGASLIRRREAPVIALLLHRNEQLFHGIASSARQFNWRIVDLEITRHIIPPGVNPRGLLSSGSSDQALVSSLRSQGCQAVRIGTFPHPLDSCEVPAVLPDLTAAGRLVAEHFAERAFKNVAYVGNFPWRETPYLYEGFRQRAVELGCESHLLQVKDPPGQTSSIAEGIQYRLKQIGAWLQTLPKPVGVYTYSDRMAAMICTAAASVHLDIPEQVALVGNGNEHLTCEFAPVPLSSVNADNATTGREAVRLLHRLMKGEMIATPRIMIPPAGVVARRSTDLFAIPDPVVARAMRFVWDHLDLPISVDDVAREVSVSRSVLDRRFRQHLKRGVNAELRRKRLEQCAHLLRTTDRKITDVAAACGFRSMAYLHRIFQRTYGVTPRQYRN